MRRILLSLMLAVMIHGRAIADDWLEVGDSAPSLDVAHWLLGEDVMSFEPGSVYVIEFWATWCGPCVASMSHLSELQARHAEDGVTIVGVSNEPLQRVVKFLFSDVPRENGLQRHRIAYTLGTDPDGSAWNDYLKAAGFGGIPVVFVVGPDGLIEWMGYPRKLDPVLKAVLDGSWDRTAEQHRARIQQAQRRQFNEARVAMREALDREDWEAAVEAYARITESSLEHFEYVAPPFEILLNEIRDRERAYEYARRQAERFWDTNERVLYHFAWKITDAPESRRDLDFALKVITRANELTDYAADDMLEMLALVHAQRGEFDQAAAMQEKALDVVRGWRPRIRDDELERYESELLTFERRLAAYRAGHSFEDQP